MVDTEDIRRQLSRLLAEQRLGVLSTQGGGQPYASLVAFAVSEDLCRLGFATPRTTRKFANLAADGRVAFLVHDAANRQEDLHRAVAVTAVGRAEVQHPPEEALVSAYRRKHPALQGFLAAPSSVFVCVHVAVYHLVRRFQNVVEYVPAP